MDRNMIFWSEVADGSQETDGFLPDFKRISLEYIQTAKENFVLSEESNQAFQKFSKGRKQNLFLLLCAGVSAILMKYCFAEKVIFGVPTLLTQKKRGLKNDFVLFKAEENKEEHFYEFVHRIGDFYKSALLYQNIAAEVLADTLGLITAEDKPLIKTMIMMRGLHNVEIADKLYAETAFMFNEEDGNVNFSIQYNASIFKQETIHQIGTHLLLLYEKVSADADVLLNEIDVLLPNEHEKIESFQGSVYPLKENENVITSFKKSVQKFSNKISIVDGTERITYSELDKLSNKIAGFLQTHCNKPKYVGIYMKNCQMNVAAILGTIKSGAAYVPIDYDLPYERIKAIAADINVSIIISLKEHIPFLNKLQIECTYMRYYLCLDTNDVYQLESPNDNDLSDRKLWEFVGSRAVDKIEGGGWQSSYTGENFSEEEMNEYGENVRIKLEPYLNGDQKVLEIGCASGITMFRIAPYVKSYYGTDLAQTILDKDEEYIKEKHIDNITLQRFAALEIDNVLDNGFDVVIINSVIQCFDGYNYFRKVFEKVLDIVSDHALIFIGDIMDADFKDKLINSLRDFAATSFGKGYTTKTDWSKELFFSRDFFYDLKAEYSAISEVEFSTKIGSIENELTEFRFDTILHIDKTIQNTVLKKINMQYGRDILNKCETFYQPVKILETDSAYIIYTSGTTGKPKGIEIMHGSLMRLCNWNNRYYEITEKDVSTRYARSGFDASVWELFPFLCAGSEIHIIPEEIRLNIVKLNSYFEKNYVSFTFLPTQICEQFTLIENHSLRIVVTGGDKLHNILPQNYKIFNNYGPTESTVVATAFEIDDIYNNIPIGKPIDNTRIHIVDRKGLSQPVGTIGELCISGDNLAKGYIGMPDMTKEKFRDGSKCGELVMYHTGDLARWLSDGNIEYFGRMDGQVKVSAFRIEIEEIQNTLCEISCVRQAVIKSMSSEGRTQLLCAYVMIDNDVVTVDEIKKYLASKLPEYMVPSFIILMKEFPISPNGKINYTKLPDPIKYTQKDEIIQPENDIEKELAKIYCKVLEIDQINVTESFFNVGGNSISAIKLVAELTKKYQVTINDVFSYQSIRELAKNLTASDKNLEHQFSRLRNTIEDFISVDPLEQEKNKYNTYLESLESINENIIFKNNRYSAVLLMGVTGFLGIHLLEQILSETEADVITVIRCADANEGLNRIDRKWKHHFGSSIPATYLSRIKSFSGDLEAEHFGLSEKDYNNIAEQADCIINTAANVRHYGHYDEFLSINSELINKLIEFAAEKRQKDIHHVSTIGIAEGTIPNCSISLFTEDDSDLGQTITNYYTKTKLLAEQYIYSARQSGINVVIYRVGNLVANSSTGVFQENIESNGFYKIMRSMIAIKAIPDVSVRTLDFSFVDSVSDAMIKLVFSDGKPNENYHLFNPYEVSMMEMAEMLESTGHPVKHMSLNEFLEFIYLNYESLQYGEFIKEFILHTRLFSISDETHFTLLCKRTCETLSRLGFFWKKPDVETVGRMLDYCIKIGFLTC